MNGDDGFQAGYRVDPEEDLLVGISAYCFEYAQGAFSFRAARLPEVGTAGHSLVTADRQAELSVGGTICAR